MIRPITRYDGAVTERAGGGFMAGPKDRSLDQQQGPDSVRTRESDRVGADLRQRLEQLPPGHPSSPYNDDGFRKPPEPDPFEHDYPIPGDPDYAPADDDPGRELPFGDQEGIRDPDSREQSDRRLSQITDQLAERCREAEGRDPDGSYTEQGLTPAMRRIEAQAGHSKLAPETEKYALKGRDRFMEKLVEMVTEEPDKSAYELAIEIHDGIRYTFLIDTEHYAAGIRELTNMLEEGSFELGVIKNTWGNDEYKGVNTRWLDRQSGLRFEVQFHTEQSWIVKQATHDAYVEIHDVRTPLEERERLRDYQREISAQVLQPPESESIPDLRKDGW